MIIMKILATVFALIVLAKIILLLVARDTYLQLVDKLYQSERHLVFGYAVAAVVVGLPVLLQVPIVEIGAVMLWMSLLIGLWLAPFKEIVLKLRDEAARMDLSRAWWLMAVWAGLAVWILAAVFRD